MRTEVNITTKRTTDLINALTELWERSVRASHHFLNEDDIARLRGFVPQAVRGIQTLAVAYDSSRPVGFVGVESGKIEMLFVEPEYFGKGIGGQLLNMAVQECGARFIDVNEQNSAALAIYRHWGFREYDRSETDDQGYPFPILRMELRK